MEGEMQPSSGSPSEQSGATLAANAIEPWLLALLACPVDRGAVRLDGGALVCETCGRRYPVKDGIPVMIADDAE